LKNSQMQEGSVMKNHTLCSGEKTKNEVRLAREIKIIMEEEVDASTKRVKIMDSRSEKRR